MCCDGGFPAPGSFAERAREVGAAPTLRRLARALRRLRAPNPASPSASTRWLERARFGRREPLPLGHEFLTVGWHGRIDEMGPLRLSLPRQEPRRRADEPALAAAHGGTLPGGAPFQINEHGLALWFTTPLYLWLLWPKGLDSHADRRWLYAVAALSAALPAAFDLLYQNSGWRQFGYRFSNDYSILLFVLLAIGARPMRALFAIAAAWSVAWNAFGAAHLRQGRLLAILFHRGSQTVVYQPD